MRNAGFQAKGNNVNYLSAWTYGSGRTATIFGKTMGSHSAILAQGSDNTGLLLGTLSASPIVIGTGGIERMEVGATGTVKLSSLAGTGTRMVTADESGNLSTSGEITIDSGKVNFTTNEIKVKPTTTLSLVADTWYNVCVSAATQPDDVIMVNLACFISAGNNHSALITVTKAAGFYGTATTIASQSSGLVPSYTFRFNAGFLQISFNATNLPANFNAHTIARFS